MVSITHTIRDFEGLHARPVAAIVAATRPWASAVRVGVGERVCDGRDLMGLMGLGARRGDVLTVEVEGPDEVQAAEALRAVFSF